MRGEIAPAPKAVRQMAFDAVSQTIDLRASPVGPESVLRADVGDIPPSVVETVAVCEELVGETGQLLPYGVIAGMAFAMVTRASCGARLNWFQSLDWWKVSCMLRWLAPGAQEDKKSTMDARRGFGKIAEPDAFDCQRAMLPVQPDDESRAWGVNSFAMLPMF